MKRSLTALFASSIVLALCSCIGKYQGMDYARYFKKTPVRELAKAVRDNDIDRIRELVIEKGYDVNYQAPSKGYTLLILAVANHQSFLWPARLKTIETLLELGADPNIHIFSHSTGSNAVHIAAATDYEVLKLVLDYGGDPNSQSIRTNDRFGRTNESTAMTSVLESPWLDDKIKSLELLLDRGADINKKNKVGKGNIDVCINRPNLMKELLFFLERGIDYDIEINDYSRYDENDNPKKIYILDGLRKVAPPLDSREYEYKMKVVDFLKERGLDYWSTPIPDDIMELIKQKYPDNWEEYAAKY